MNRGSSIPCEGDPGSIENRKRVEAMETRGMSPVQPRRQIYDMLMELENQQVAMRGFMGTIEDKVYGDDLRNETVCGSAPSQSQVQQKKDCVYTTLERVLSRNRCILDTMERVDNGL